MADQDEDHARTYAEFVEQVRTHAGDGPLARPQPAQADGPRVRGRPPVPGPGADRAVRGRVRVRRPLLLSTAPARAARTRPPPQDRARLRGTRLDPFGYAGVRRIDRELVTEYREAITQAFTGPEEVLLEIAELPDLVRGYEHVKLGNVAAYRRRLAELLDAGEREQERRTPRISA
jgi:indolepyruvate ferredoxin oxidoreductase